jgi:hypothetical protein
MKEAKVDPSDPPTGKAVAVDFLPQVFANCVQRCPGLRQRPAN